MPEDANSRKTLFAEMAYHLPVVAALDGTIPAQFFVDGPDEPRAALLKYKHRLYLAGAADETFLRRTLLEEIFPQVGDRFVFVLYYETDDWTPVIEAALQDLGLNPAPRQYYAFTSSRPQHDWRALLPEGFSLAVVDEKLLAQTYLENLDKLKEEMCSERLSVEDFLANSFGTCVIHNDKLVAWCLSEYNSGMRCEVGIETQEAYQRRGLATAVASGLIEHALAQGVTEIGWHCYARNTPSVAAARRIGFEHVRDYHAFIVYEKAAGES